MLTPVMYNIYTEHMKHEYIVETIIHFAVETGTERPQPDLYLHICNAGGRWTRLNISHVNLYVICNSFAKEQSFYVNTE